MAVSKNSELGGLYRFTSLYRPIDPAYLTNRALIHLLPVIALISGVDTALTEPDLSPFFPALQTVLVCFVSWALTRELAPDYSSAAFVALCGRMSPMENDSVLSMLIQTISFLLHLSELC